MLLWRKSSHIAQSQKAATGDECTVCRDDIAAAVHVRRSVVNISCDSTGNSGSIQCRYDDVWMVRGGGVNGRKEELR